LQRAPVPRPLLPAATRRIVEAVSARAKLLILLFVVSAILYVLISPLPEMAATKSVQSLLRALLAVVVIVLPSHLVRSLFLGAFRSRLEECCDFQAELCSRQC